MLVIESVLQNGSWDVGEKIIFLTPPPYQQQSNNTHAQLLTSFPDGNLIMPGENDSYHILTNRPLSSEDAYGFSTSPGLILATETTIVPPIDFILEDNYPNPFNSTTRISFDLLQDATLSLYVTDATGRIKTTFSDKEFYNSGKYNFDWNAESFSTGVYFFTINAEVEGYLPILFSRKMIYLK